MTNPDKGKIQEYNARRKTLLRHIGYGIKDSPHIIDGTDMPWCWVVEKGAKIGVTCHQGGIGGMRYAMGLVYEGTRLVGVRMRSELRNRLELWIFDKARVI